MAQVQQGAGPAQPQSGLNVSEKRGNCDSDVRFVALKLLVAGSCAVGKSSIITRFCVR
jgi:GTPase SAR1 family protein